MSIRGFEHPNTLTARKCEAFAYRQTGRASQAIVLFQTLLADCERIPGGEDPSTLTTRHNLAYAYQAAGRVGEAIAILQRLLAQDRDRPSR
ncbi:MAG: tetratricopeptide repeat protein [Solirubrobacteraceae bacterium]|jgi:cytochrome c-type biogenesis protein CcmH/NrfG